ncbi:hypothetical protein Tco_0765973 [Tanacetum coccineum]
MAQHVIPAAQLVSQYKPIGRCNNYAVLQSIPCSPECKIVGLILLDHYTLQLPVKTPENPFVAPANIHTIKAFMNRVGYQGVVDKVSAFFTKNLAQPWQTMFKEFNRCLTTRTSGHDQTKINILQLFHVVINRTHVDYVALIWWDFMNNMFQKKEAIQYPQFTKLIIVDLIKKFPNIPKRIEEDYHSIKDDIPLVSVYTTGNVSVRGMLILNTFLTAEIRETDDFKEYEMVFMKMKKRRQTAGESSSPRKSLKITIKKRQTVEKDDDDTEDRIEPRSHKDNPKFIDDDDDKAEEKNSDDMGSLEIRNEETQTTIPIPLRCAEFQDVDKRVPTIFDRARMEATLRDSLSNQSRNAEEYAYHLEQSTNFMENQIVWESSQQDIPRTIPKTLIFYGPQKNLNEPPRFTQKNFQNLIWKKS